MRNKTILGFLLLTIIIFVSFFLFKRNSISPQVSPTNTPTTFNLIFRYGVGAKNELNTFNNTFTKDMIVESPLTVNFQLTNDELDSMYQKINELKLFDKNEEKTDGNMRVTPCSSYYLKVQIDSTQKELSWDYCHGNPSDKLQKFSRFMISIIESKEEYKKLPRPKGGYL